MYFVPFISAPAAKVLEPITHNPENINAPTGKTILMNFILQEQNKTTIKKLPKLGFYIKRHVITKLNGLKSSAGA